MIDDQRNRGTVAFDAKLIDDELLILDSANNSVFSRQKAVEMDVVVKVVTLKETR